MATEAIVGYSHCCKTPTQLKSENVLNGGNIGALSQNFGPSFKSKPLQNESSYFQRHFGNVCHFRLEKKSYRFIFIDILLTPHSNNDGTRTARFERFLDFSLGNHQCNCRGLSSRRQVLRSHGRRGVGHHHTFGHRQRFSSKKSQIITCLCLPLNPAGLQAYSS